MDSINKQLKIPVLPDATRSPSSMGPLPILSNFPGFTGNAVCGMAGSSVRRRFLNANGEDILLVGGIPTPLKNMKVNWDDEIPNIWENKIMGPDNPTC